MRQKYICILVLLLTTACISFARSENKELAVEYIPAALRTNADAVVRYDSTSMQLLDRSNLRYRQKIAITILNGDGKAFGNIWESYSNLVKIKHIKATLFDANGKEIGTMKEKDLFDQSQFAFDIMYHSDARIKKFAFNHGVFPYTVVIDIEREFETTFFIPDWSPQPKYNVSVQHSVLSITYPQEQVIRHKSYLMPENARYDSLQEDYNTVMRWIVDDVKSFRPQPYAHAGDFKYPTVLCAALYFSLKDHEGNMKTWKELGKFVYTLNKERDQLPENKKLLVHQLIKDVPDLYGKVEKLYQYMQENTRYFANVYGLAGWQTYDAISVAQSGYGDCKGLTNYLKALLQEAGIPSYSTLVFAGSDGYVQLDPEFPTNSFNHVILCVPTPKDTIWVECTSKTLAAGYLGSFTQGRWALITSAEGG